jgi:predicted nucleic acid-binding protein
MPIIDASSIQAALRRHGADAALLLHGQTILDLTLYELGNIIWKETRDSAEAKTHAQALEKLLSITKIHRITTQALPDIARNTVKHSLTFYDAAYLTAAQTTADSLITEDNELLEAATETGLTATNLEKHLETQKITTCTHHKTSESERTPVHPQ